MSTYTTPAASTTSPSVEDVAAIHRSTVEPIPYRLSDLDTPVPFAVVEDEAAPAAATDLAALRSAAKDALDHLVAVSERNLWGEVADDEVDRASAVFCELQDAYYSALKAATRRGDEKGVAL